jgi:ABC-type sugar transport system ATPase subunit/ribose/xylose/arabinose/galactoside ABC-type transport system permease subunit
VLVGENGAGKSTLLKVLAGVVRADGGEILLAGTRTAIHSPVDARRHGIQVVHQHSHLVPQLTVAENLALREGYPLRGGRVDWRRVRERARDAGAILAPRIPVDADAASLGTVEKRLVELSFALAANPRILILDEPTAVLPRQETEALFLRLREYAARGGLALFVSHRLNEVFEIADGVAVLRDGCVVWQRPAAQVDHDGLIRAMVGRSVEFERDESPAPAGAPGLLAEAIEVAGATGNVSLRVRCGEIYGIYGLVGAGQSELAHALFGIVRAGGETRVGSASVSGRTPRERVRAGLAYVPADRLEQGVFRQMTVCENASIASLGSLTRLGIIRRGEENARAWDAIRDLGIRALGPSQAILQLSGGNQQKVMLARWLGTDPRVLILEEPTQGVDVGAKGEIHRVVRDLARRGVAVLLISSEIPELLALSHRVGVMREGRLAAELDGSIATEEQILCEALPGAADGPGETVGGKEGGQRATCAVHLRGALAHREASLALVVAAIAAVCAATVPAFATWRNLQDLLVNQSIILVGALAVLVVVVAGSIDISIGAMLGLAAVAAGKADLSGAPPWACVAAAAATGAALGLINGALTVAGRIHSIVVTLGTMFIFRGLLIEVMGGRWINGLTDSVTRFGQSSVAGVPTILLIALAFGAAVHAFMRHTVAGRRLYAFGGDRESAAYAGIGSWRVLPVAFGLAGLLTGIAGLLQAGRYGQVQTNVGQGYEMKVIAAAVIGGAHIMGGRGSAFGTVLGAVFLGLIANALVLTHVSAFWEGVAVGTMILLAVLLDALLGARVGAGR